MARDLGKGKQKIYFNSDRNLGTVYNRLIEGGGRKIER